MIEHNNFKQGSLEWLSFKLGKIGGTRLKDIYKSENLTLVDEIIAELGSGEIEQSYVTAAMQRGTDLEPYVRDLFQELHRIVIDEVGICQHDSLPYLVCSPDGFSQDRTIGIEIKCPNTKSHVKTIRQGAIPNEYTYQVINYFLVNEKCEKVYFISFDDRYKPKPYFEIVANRSDYNLETEITCLKNFWQKVEKYLKIVNK